MANNTASEARKIISDIRKGVFSPVYLLMGPESYYIDMIVENIEKYAIPEEDRDFNYSVFYGNDADIDYVVGVAQQFPVMAPRKLVILKEAQSMVQAKVKLERFASYFARPNQTTIFVLAFKGDSLNATSKLVKGAKEGGAVIFKSEAVREWEVAACIRDYCQQHKMGIDDKAVALLADYIGLPLSKLFGELNKLMSVKGPGSTRIDCDDIERNIGISKDFNNFEFLDALRNKDYPKAVRIIKYFASNKSKNPTAPLIGLMFGFYSNLVIAYYMPDKSEAAIRQQFGFKAPAQLRGFMTAMRLYNPRQAVNAIHYLRDFDLRSKGRDSYFDEHDLLAELVFKLFT